MTLEHGQGSQEAGMDRRLRDFNLYGLKLTVAQGPVAQCAHTRLIPSPISTVTAFVALHGDLRWTLTRPVLGLSSARCVPQMVSKEVIAPHQTVVGLESQ